MILNPPRRSGTLFRQRFHLGINHIFGVHPGKTRTTCLDSSGPAAPKRSQKTVFSRVSIGKSSHVFACIALAHQDYHGPPINEEKGAYFRRSVSEDGKVPIIGGSISRWLHRAMWEAKNREWTTNTRVCVWSLWTTRMGSGSPPLDRKSRFQGISNRLRRHAFFGIGT